MTRGKGGGPGSNQYQQRGTSTVSAERAARTGAQRFTHTSDLPREGFRSATLDRAMACTTWLRAVDTGHDPTGVSRANLLTAGPVLADEVDAYLGRHAREHDLNHLADEIHTARVLGGTAFLRDLDERECAEYAAAVGALSRAVLDPGLDPTEMRPVDRDDLWAAIGAKAVAGRSLDGGRRPVHPAIAGPDQYAARDVTTARRLPVDIGRADHGRRLQGAQDQSGSHAGPARHDRAGRSGAPGRVRGRARRHGRAHRPPPRLISWRVDGGQRALRGRLGRRYGPGRG